MRGGRKYKVGKTRKGLKRRETRRHNEKRGDEGGEEA